MYQPEIDVHFLLYQSTDPITTKQDTIDSHPH